MERAERRRGMEWKKKRKGRLLSGCKINKLINRTAKVSCKGSQSTDRHDIFIFSAVLGFKSMSSYMLCKNSTLTYSPSSFYFETRSHCLSWPSCCPSFFSFQSTWNNRPDPPSLDIFIFQYMT